MKSSNFIISLEKKFPENYQGNFGSLLHLFFIVFFRNLNLNVYRCGILIHLLISWLNYTFDFSALSDEWTVFLGDSQTTRNLMPFSFLLIIHRIWLIILSLFCQIEILSRKWWKIISTCFFYCWIWNFSVLIFVFEVSISIDWLIGKFNEIKFRLLSPLSCRAIFLFWLFLHQKLIHL